MKKHTQNNITYIDLSQSTLGNARTIDEKVLEKLRADQEKRKFKDAGSFVPGSAKERAARKSIISYSDLEILEQDSITAMEMVVKDKIWEKYDFAEMKAKGVSPGTAYFINELRKAYPPRPNKNTPEARKQYVEFAERIIALLSIALNYDDIRKGLNEMDLSYWGLKAEVSTRFANLLFGRQGGAKVYKKVLEYDGTAFQTIIDNSIRGIEYYKKAIERTKQIDYNDLHKELRTQTYYLAKNNLDIRDVDESDLDKFRQSNIEQLKTTIKKLKENIKKAKASLAKTPDWSWAFDKKATDRKATTDIKLNSGKPLAFIKRTGGLLITDKMVSEKEIIKTFGFKGVQLGKSISDKEVKEHIRHFIGAMADLFEILDWDTKQVIEMGGLSIAFAARGKGSAMAHYESSRKIINLTRSNGDGTVAHEWAHYLDNLLARFYDTGDADMLTGAVDVPAVNKKRYYQRFQLGYGEIAETLFRLFFYIRFGRLYNDNTPPPENYVEYKFLAQTKYSYKLPILETPEKTLESLERKYPQYFKYPATHKNQKNVFGFVAHKHGLKSIKVKIMLNNITEFYFYSKEKGAYWGRNWEIFARGFETYILDKFINEKRENNYLVSGGWFDHPAKVYPQGKEREIMFVLYDNLMKAIKTQLKIGDFKPFTTKRTDEFIELDAKKEKVKSEKIFIENEKRNHKIKLAIAKAKAIKIKLELLAMENKKTLDGYYWNDNP